jgi:hypothetical protein
MPLLQRCINSHAKLVREREESERIYGRSIRQRLYDEPACLPKYVAFDGITCVNAKCRSRVEGRPAEHKAYFEQLSGRRVCNQCGTVQPGSQVMVQEEERRTFADDRERGVDHARTERVREGETGTGASSVPAKLRFASRKVESVASAEVKNREVRYKKCTRELGEKIEGLASIALESAMKRAPELAEAVGHHRECCPDKKCRLRQTPQSGYLMGAALVRLAAKDYDRDITINDLALTYLSRVDRVYTPGRVSETYGVVRDLLRGYYNGGQYSCMVADVQAPAGAPDTALLKYTEPVLRVCEDAGLPYSTQIRAKEVVVDWFKKGLGGNTPQVVAGAAVWCVVKDEGGQIEAVANAAGCNAATITQVLASLV